MSQSQSFQQNNTNSEQANRGQGIYFNVHTEGLGYLANLREVPAEPGKDAFYKVDFCMLEGDPTNTEKVYIGLSLPAKQVLDVLLSCSDAINDRDQTVFAAVRLAKLRAEPFVYPATSKRAGQLGVNYSARAIKLIHLKVNGQSVHLVSNKSQQHSSADQRSPQPERPSISSSTPLFSKPVIVKLSKDDVNFEENKERLKNSGYRWNSEIESWCQPEVKLSKNDPLFHKKREFLSDKGYCWDSNKCAWTMRFAKPNNNRSGNNSRGSQRDNRGKPQYRNY